jgi:hsp70-interacting protein
MTVNPVDRLKLCISKIKDTEVNEQQKQEFLDELCHWAEELDLAKDFFTIGGLDVLTLLLDHNDEDTRAKACSLLATLVQNNDHCQRIIVQSGLQQKLLKIVEESNNPDLKTKAVTAISGKDNLKAYFLLNIIGFL